MANDGAEFLGYKIAKTSWDYRRVHDLASRACPRHGGTLPRAVEDDATSYAADDLATAAIGAWEGLWLALGERVGRTAGRFDKKYRQTVRAGAPTEARVLDDAWRWLVGPLNDARGALVHVTRWPRGFMAGHSGNPLTWDLVVEVGPLDVPLLRDTRRLHHFAIETATDFALAVDLAPLPECPNCSSDAWLDGPRPLRRHLDDLEHLGNPMDRPDPRGPRS